MRPKVNLPRRQHPVTGGACAALRAHSRQAPQPEAVTEPKRSGSAKRAKSKAVLDAKTFGAGTILDRRWGHLL